MQGKAGLLVTVKGFGRLVEHSDGWRQFVDTSLGPAFEEHIVAFGLEIVIPAVVGGSGFSALDPCTRHNLPNSL